MIYVTHDQIEAMTLADKIVVLRAGVIEQVGAPLTLYDDPDNMFVAGFIGSPRMNFMDAVPVAGGIRVPVLGDLEVPSAVHVPGGALTVGIRPEHMELVEGDAVKLDLIEHLGGVSYVHLVTEDGQRLIAEGRAVRDMKTGSRRDVRVDPAHLYLFDPETGLRLR